MLRPAFRGQLEYPEHDVRHHWYFETDYTTLKHSSSLLLEHMTTSVCSQVSFSTVIPKLVQMDDYDSEPMHDVMILLSQKPDLRPVVAWNSEGNWIYMFRRRSDVQISNLHLI